MLHGFTGSKENWYPVARRPARPLSAADPGPAGLGREPAHRRRGLRLRRAEPSASRRSSSRSRRPAAASCCSAIRWAAASPRLTAAAIRDDVARVGLFDAAGVRFNDNRFGARGAGRARIRSRVDDEASLQRYLDTVFHRRQGAAVDPVAGSRGIYIARRTQRCRVRTAGARRASAAATNASCPARPPPASASRRCCCGAGRMR